MINPTVSFPLAALNFRKELRLALLAAMESCWVYAALVFLAAWTRLPPFASPLTLFLVYWVAMILGRELPRRPERWGILQAAAILSAVVLVLFVARVELFAPSDLFDFSWLTRFIPALALSGGFSRAIYTTLAVLYMFIRGLGFGSRPLTLWFVGFQFRLGVVVFFVVFLASAVFRPIEVSPWVFVYFALSLIAISLARMDEIGSDLRYGPRWAFILLGGVAFVFFLGLALLQFFTLDTTTAFLRLFSPLLIFLQAIALLILIPASLLAGFLIDLLRPFFVRLDEFLQQLPLPSFENARTEFDKVVQANDWMAFLVPILRTAVILLVVLWIGARIARALNRRMQQADEALYAREALESEDETTRAKRALGPKKKPAHLRGSISAESIRRVYAALVARAGEAGITRREAETPYEFLPRISQEWQEQSDTVREITEAYVAVHYGERAATAEEVGAVRAAWRRLEEKIKSPPKNTRKKS